MAQEEEETMSSAFPHKRRFAWKITFLLLALAILLLWVVFGVEQKDLMNLMQLTVSEIQEYAATSQVEEEKKVDPTSILRGEVPWPGDSTKLVKFRPGTLNMTRVETLRHCHVDNTIYAKHSGLDRSSTAMRLSISDKHKLVYVLLPKSGSSTARWVMQNGFGAREQITSVLQLHSKGYEIITFVREPLSRFFSSYSEMFHRTSPWYDPNNKNYKPPPSYPYLHEGMRVYEDFANTFCPPETRQHHRDCAYRETQENGTLAARFERFVRDYDGRTPFDEHLKLQVPLLMMKNGSEAVPFPLDWLYETGNATQEWRAIARAKQVTLPEQGQYNARSYPKRYDVTKMSNQTFQRICHLVALDYCCLNYPLPPVCQDTNVSCALERHGRPKIRPYTYPT